MDANSSSWEVYALRLENTHEYRYVGMSVHGAKHRLKQHVNKSMRDPVTSKERWIHKHTSAGRRIVADVLEIIDSENYSLFQFREKFWIASLRESGYDLLNLTDGGEGVLGWSPPPETRKRWSDSRKGTITGEKNPNWGKFGKDHHSFGMVFSGETLELFRQQKLGPNNPNYGKKLSDDTRRKMSEAQKGIPKPSSARSAHKRYHINKSVFRDSCKNCIIDRNNCMGICPSLSCSFCNL